ncbi:hypothetical protein CVO74_01840 [Xanthomonas prunicola]|uniref:Uncharacterized protein n=1 Tax=Xanthomonas prunicola TaxID=2053930 RepID=A0A2N3RPB7_9XANT|nr:hypothetical protein XpruCFBP8353_04615 [Xanthomonas prunicola]PKV18620.1 hypothetical protein XpruCFBP8354_04615 [Xanthomonas prunicola]PKV22071.1 hypothetical protein CVO74_01840 [Xanthomonas prunicola]
MPASSCHRNLTLAGYPHRCWPLTWLIRISALAVAVAVDDASAHRMPMADAGCGAFFRGD